jgi:hypothetical protein
MSEITKLYENAGIEKEVIKGCYEYYSENGGIDIYTVNDCKNKDCNTCKADKSIKEYPPFTAEKQLEITKFLLKKAVYYDVKDNKYWFYYEECESAGYKPFDEAIAHFINKLWTDMSEAEKQQVKGILEVE